MTTTSTPMERVARIIPMVGLALVSVAALGVIVHVVHVWATLGASNPGVERQRVLANVIAFGFYDVLFFIPGALLLLAASWWAHRRLRRRPSSPPVREGKP